MRNVKLDSPKNIVSLNRSAKNNPEFNRLLYRRVRSARLILAAAILAVCFVLFSDHALRVCQAQSQTNRQTSQTAQLYFFTDHGCAPCRQVQPAIKALKAEGYPVETIYLSTQPQMGRQFGVDRTPTVVLISGNKMVGRHAGLIDAVTLKKWFAVIGVSSGANFRNAQNGARGAQPVGGTKVMMSEPNATNQKSADEYSTPTIHKGTERPKNANERLALQATVRLKVEDPKGISYATGTVIHSHQGECLVMTCGHVFRESQGKGEISAEYGFDKAQTKSAPGQLIFFDADARDIALVAIKASEKIEPVKIASRVAQVERGNTVFSLGCDHGEDPTIRHSKIKNRAAYDGAIKYDIYGRPVDGRSGGGLFNERGELIGVCNAAAVEEDEGIYTALDTVYWQIAKVNLEHLFDGSINRGAAAAVGSDMRLASADRSADTRWNTSRNTPGQRIVPQSKLAWLNAGDAAANSAKSGLGRTPVSWGGGNANEKEVIIIVRSKNDPRLTESITVSDPSPRLLNYLKTMNGMDERRRVQVANLRELN